MEELMFATPQTGIMFYGKRAAFLLEHAANCYEKDGWIVVVDVERAPLARFKVDTIIAIVRRLPSMPDSIQHVQSEAEILQ